MPLYSGTGLGSPSTGSSLYTVMVGDEGDDGDDEEDEEEEKDICIMLSVDTLGNSIQTPTHRHTATHTH